MRVLLVSAIPPPAGGIGTWTEKYLKYASSYGIDVDLVNIALIGRRGKKINSKTNYIDEIKRTINIFQSLKTYLKNKTYDVIHINTSCGMYGLFRDYLCVLIASKYNCRLIIQCHCNISSQINNFLQRWVMRRITKKTYCTLVLNKESEEWIREKCDVKVFLVPNFIETSIIKQINVRNEIKNFLFVGHVQNSKGLSEILEVAKMFTHYIFELIGPIKEDDLKDEIPKNIVLTGEMSHEMIKSKILESDVFLFPSHSEGFSIAMLEAMASGLPIIATNVGANKDMIQNDGGIIVNVKNVNEIIDAINRIRDYEKRKSMSIWNIKKVNEQYTVDAFFGLLIRIYSE